jgi:hypothetical protein
MTATTGNILRFSITNHTEYYDKLLYYTGGSVGTPLSRVLFYTLGKVWEPFTQRRWLL